MYFSNKKGCDSNSENNPKNDYPEEISENDDRNGLSMNEEDEENSERRNDEDEDKDDIYFEEAQENEFYENFKKKFIFIIVIQFLNI